MLELYRFVKNGTRKTKKQNQNKKKTNKFSADLRCAGVELNKTESLYI